MNLQLRRFYFSLVVLTASLTFASISHAQLVPPGDFRGKPLAQWGLDYGEWAFRTEFGGQSLPNTVNGVRYLPPSFPGHPSVVNLTISQGTALVSNPFFLYGERYNNGTEDQPTDPIVNALIEAARLRITVDGNVVLDGPVNSFPNRKYGVSTFPEPLPFNPPEARGPGLLAIAVTFQAGMTTIYDLLPIGNHTIREEFFSNLAGNDLITYNITVVPEPTGLLLVGAGAIGLPMMTRRWSLRLRP